MLDGETFGTGRTFAVYCSGSDQPKTSDYGAISISAAMTTGRLSGKATAPMAVRAWARHRPVQVEDELGDGVDDRSGLVVAGISVDVAADGHPGGDAIEVAEGVLEAGQDGEGGQQ